MHPSINDLERAVEEATECAEQVKKLFFACKVAELSDSVREAVIAETRGLWANAEIDRIRKVLAHQAAVAVWEKEKKALIDWWETHPEEIST